MNLTYTIAGSNGDTLLNESKEIIDKLISEDTNSDAEFQDKSRVIANEAFAAISGIISKVIARHDIDDDLYNDVVYNLYNKVKNMNSYTYKRS